MRVTFQYSNTGREKVMNEREAGILVKLGHGKVLSGSRPTYLTRDMQAAAPVALQPSAVADPVENAEEDEFEDLDDITEARAMSDTQEPSIAPKRRGRPPKDPK